MYSKETKLFTSNRNFLNIIIVFCLFVFFFPVTRFLECSKQFFTLSAGFNVTTQESRYHLRVSRATTIDINGNANTQLSPSIIDFLGEGVNTLWTFWMCVQPRKTMEKKKKRNFKKDRDQSQGA